MADYEALADHHSEEVVNILEEYVAVDLVIAQQLQQYGVDKQATRRQTVETVELQDSPLVESVTNVQGELLLITRHHPTGNRATKGRPEPAPLHVPKTTPPPASLPTTNEPPQREPCPTTTTELPSQPGLTAKPTTIPLAEPTPKPKLPRQDTSEPHHTDDTLQSLETETVAPNLPPITMPTPDPRPHAT